MDGFIDLETVANSPGAASVCWCYQHIEAIEMDLVVLIVTSNSQCIPCISCLLSVIMATPLLKFLTVNIYQRIF